ncbi:hypothetical protein ACRAWG_16065 [Methylobacterium sp. P31]
MALTAMRQKMDRLIAEIELWTMVQAGTVAALARSQGDTTQATEHLYRQMDRLAALRLERAEIECLIRGEPGTAPKSGFEV